MSNMQSREQGVMQGVVAGLVALLAGALWLLLLVISHFHLLVISGGLLGTLYVMEQSAGTASNQLTREASKSTEWTITNS